MNRLTAHAISAPQTAKEISAVWRFMGRRRSAFGVTNRNRNRDRTRLFSARWTVAGKRIFGWLQARILRTTVTIVKPEDDKYRMIAVVPEVAGEASTTRSPQPGSYRMHEIIHPYSAQIRYPDGFRLSV